MKTKALSMLVLFISLIGFNLAPVEAEAVLDAWSWGYDRTGDCLITPGTIDQIAIDWGLGPDWSVYEKYVQVYADGVLTFDYVGSKWLTGITWVNTNHLGTYNEIHVWYLNKENCYSMVAFTLPLPTDDYGWVWIQGTVVCPAVPATVDIDPDTLNLKSNGEWVTTYIELPSGYDVNNICVESILLNGILPIAAGASVTVGDYDTDGVPDLMVKFGRVEVIDHIETLDFGDETGRFREVTLTVTGALACGKAFEGSDTVRVIV